MPFEIKKEWHSRFFDRNHQDNLSEFDRHISVDRAKMTWWKKKSLLSFLAEHGIENPSTFILADTAKVLWEGFGHLSGSIGSKADVKGVVYKNYHFLGTPNEKDLHILLEVYPEVAKLREQATAEASRIGKPFGQILDPLLKKLREKLIVDERIDANRGKILSIPPRDKK